MAEKGRYSIGTGVLIILVGPKGPTRNFKTRLSFSARDNVKFFSIKVALWKITVSFLNPIC